MKKRFFKTKDEVEVTFEAEGHQFDGVSLCSEHNAWEPIPMKRVRSGAWKVALRLPLDRDVQFRYLASNGIWLNDRSIGRYRVGQRIRNGQQRRQHPSGIAARPTLGS